MKVSIHGIEYEYFDQIKENDAIRESHMELLKKSFWIDFHDWYDNGWWTNRYQPHVLVRDGQVVSAITVNYMTYRYGMDKNYIQLGGVTTREEYRNKGLGAWLMTHVIEKYKDTCDCIFLLSNDSAIDYYPKFGFQKAIEYLAEYQWKGKQETAAFEQNQRFSIEKIQMTKPENQKLFLDCYQQLNPFSSFPSVGCEAVAMIYCSGDLQDCVYYFPELELVAIAELNEKGLVLDDIYGSNKSLQGKNQPEFLKAIIGKILEQEGRANDSITIKFGFSLKEETPEFNVKELIEEDDTMYLINENLFSTHQLRFPVLSHN